MNVHESAEDYLETILILTERQKEVHSIDIANELGFSKPSISIAMKKLKDNEYIEIDDSHHIKLLEKGLKIAKNTYERHKILSSFLTTLGVSEKTAIKDACKIEHDISDESFKCIKKALKKLNN